MIVTTYTSFLILSIFNSFSFVVINNDNHYRAAGDDCTSDVSDLGNNNSRLQLQSLIKEVDRKISWFCLWHTYTQSFLNTHWTVGTAYWENQNTSMNHWITVSKPTHAEQQTPSPMSESVDRESWLTPWVTRQGNENKIKVFSVLSEEGILKRSWRGCKFFQAKSCWTWGQVSQYEERAYCNGLGAGMDMCHANIWLSQRHALIKQVHKA